MKRYIALLRGINISGKNRITMSDLKAGFIELGYTAVSTYLNSGNVIFDSGIDNKEELSNAIRFMINKQFELEIPVFVILQEELEEILKNAPECGETAARKSMITLFLCFQPYLMTDFIMKLEILKKHMRKFIIIKT